MADEPLITMLAMVCPFAPSEKQALLEAEGLEPRARLLTALFEMAGAPTAPEQTHVATLSEERGQAWPTPARSIRAFWRSWSAR